MIILSMTTDMNFLNWIYELTFWIPNHSNDEVSDLTELFSRSKLALIHKI